MADSPISPGCRRRSLYVEADINQAGEYSAIDIDLPDTATRVTGLFAATLPVSNRLYKREDAFVIFAPIDVAHPTNTASAFVVGDAATTATDPYAQVFALLRTGYKMSNGYDNFDPAIHHGFYQAITDEFPLVRLKVPTNQYGQVLAVYYAHTVTMGRPKILDGNGNALALVTEVNAVRVQTFLSQYELHPGSGNGAVEPYMTVVPDSMAFLCRVEFPAPNGDTYVQAVGYRDGILFPGDANRY